MRLCLFDFSSNKPAVIFVFFSVKILKILNWFWLKRLFPLIWIVNGWNNKSYIFIILFVQLFILPLNWIFILSSSKCNYKRSRIMIELNVAIKQELMWVWDTRILFLWSVPFWKLNAGISHFIFEEKYIQNLI